MKYIKLFKNDTEYQAFKGGLYHPKSMFKF